MPSAGSGSVDVAPDDVQIREADNYSSLLAPQDNSFLHGKASVYLTNKGGGHWSVDVTEEDPVKK